MKLDVNVLRYLSKDEFRVLTAVEMGMKNHEIVPAELVERIAGLKHGGAYKNVKTLLRHKLVHHDSSKYDGYRLTTLGYDFLAIKTMVNRGLIIGVGRQIGVGKESDIFEVITEDGSTLALKLHRLGRTSFRAVKAKRDYLRHRNSFNWLYLSRLAALKEYAFMKALSEHGFPVPKAVDWNRHCVLMTLVRGFPLVQVKELQNPHLVFETILSLIIRLARHGLIHCDFNEFNIMIDDEENVTMIDFPQMVSVAHHNAEMYFNRDVECIFKFFDKRFNYSLLKEKFKEGALPNGLVSDSDLDDEGRPDFEAVANAAGLLDKELAASGFTHLNQRDLEQYTEFCATDQGTSKGTEVKDNESSSGEDIKSTTSKLESSTLCVCNGKERNASDEDDWGTKSSKGDVEERDMRISTESMQFCELDKCNLEQVGSVQSQEDDHDSPREENTTLSKCLEKQRRRAVAAVHGGNKSHASRNFSKDKGGRRSRHVKATKFEF